jgi:gas vesicle protein
MQENTKVVLILMGVVGGLAGAILAINAAMKVYQATLVVVKVAQAALNFVMAANPIGVVVLAIAALVAALVLAYNKSETFRNGVKAMFEFIKTAIEGSVDFIKGYLNTVLGFYKSIFNGIAKLWNSTVGKLSFKVPDWVPGLGGKGFSVPQIPMLAEGGIVTGPTLAMIGEAGPEAVVPLSKMGQMGNITININSTVADDRLGDIIVNAIRQYNRRSGPAQIAVA